LIFIFENLGRKTYLYG